MRVFQSTYTQNGQTKKAKKWTVEFTDHRQRQRRLTLYSDKSATREAGRKLQRITDLRRSSEPLDHGLRTFIDSLLESRRAKLLEWDVIAPETVAASKPLSVHLKDWKVALGAKENTKQHIENSYSRANDIFNQSGFKQLSCINKRDVQKALSKMKEDGAALRTINFRLAACKQFCTWTVREGLATSNPLTHIQPHNASLDVRRERRALTVEECSKLILTVFNSNKRGCMKGPERALLYRVALGTGLRAKECRGLVVGDFDLDSPAVKVRANNAKNRREVWQPLPLELAEPLKSHFKNKFPTANAFGMGSPNTISKAFKADLAEAEIPRHDEEGRIVDFHAMRHTFITNLANSGVHPNVAKVLARHSTITLTMDHYSHVKLEDERKAIDMLPRLELQTPQQATGTTDQQGNFNLASSLALLGGFKCNSIDNSGTTEKQAQQKKQAPKQPQTRSISIETASEQDSEAGIAWRWRSDSNRRMTVLQTVA